MAVVAKLPGDRDDASTPRLDGAHPIVVFDGMCVLCSGSVQFILRHDRHARFRFLVAQSPPGQALYRRFGLPEADLGTVLVLDGGRMHTKLDAVAAVLRRLPMPWPLLSFVRLLPDVVYDLVARRRYRWFGRRDTCVMPTPGLRARFLPDGWIGGAGDSGHDRPLYARAMGDAAWARLPAVVRDAHDVSDRRVSAGQARITSGSNPVAWIVSRVMRFPPATEHTPVRVTMQRNLDGSETWTREFGRHRFRSTLSRRDSDAPGRIRERFGAMSFRLALPADETGLRMPLERGQWLGVPLPRWLTPRSETREYVDDQGRFRFDVDISLPLVGRVVRYEGWLVPVPDATLPAVTTLG